MVPTIGAIPILSIQALCSCYSPSDGTSAPVIDNDTTDRQAIEMIVQLLSHRDKT